MHIKTKERQKNACIQFCSLFCFYVFGEAKQREEAERIRAEAWLEAMKPNSEKKRSGFELKHGLILYFL
jgi:hypothetical protein